MEKEKLVLELVDLGVISESAKDSFNELPEETLNELRSCALKKVLSQKDIDNLIKNKKIDDVIKKTIGDSIEAKRRAIQEKHNIDNGITPTTIIKEIRDVISNIDDKEKSTDKMSKQEIKALIINVENEMKKAASALDFERAMELRDILYELKENKWDLKKYM